MARYYVNTNKQSNGDNEVHHQSCQYLPHESNRVYLGDFASCGPAVSAAKQKGYNANGCYFCSRPCHTG